jgi:hypothetical protein
MVVGSAPAGGDNKEEDGAGTVVKFKVLLFTRGNAASASVVAFVVLFDESHSSDAFIMVLER